MYLFIIYTSRSPHGERGLKFEIRYHLFFNIGSLPSRGAWIEIFVVLIHPMTPFVAPLTGSVD